MNPVVRITITVLGDGSVTITIERNRASVSTVGACRGVETQNSPL